MYKLTEQDIDLLYLLVDIELQNATESGQETDAYIERLNDILNKLAKA